MYLPSAILTYTMRNTSDVQSTARKMVKEMRPHHPSRLHVQILLKQIALRVGRKEVVA